MKNNILFLCFTFCLINVFSQTQYDSLKKFRDSYIQTGREMKSQTKEGDCEKVKTNLEENKQAYLAAKNDNDKSMALAQLSKISCPQIISFFEEVIKNDTSELIRCEAIQYLGWTDAQTSIHFLTERTKRTDVSNYEKVCIGTVLAVLENYKEAENILNQFCSTIEQKYCDKCIWAYYMIGNSSSINYYRFLINNSTDNFTINIAVQKLAEFGDIETAYPIMEKIMNDEDAIKVGIMRILKALGDEKSLKLIENTLNDKNESNRNYAKKLLESKN
ncbi:MAG: hypothetical protein H6Q15_1961 [Bacteroidetes bacterium]|nr:hypothetical protein [Bacteroidota bacterium]